MKMEIKITFSNKLINKIKKMIYKLINSIFLMAAKKTKTPIEFYNIQHNPKFHKSHNNNTAIIMKVYI